MTAINIVHAVGATMTFGLSCVYDWMQVALSFATRPELSTIAVCCIRVVTAFITSIMFIFRILSCSFNCDAGRVHTGKRNVSVWRPSICAYVPCFFLTLIGRSVSF